MPHGPNYGERLYQRGMKKKEQKEAVIRMARSEQLRNELDNLTFQPRTNFNRNERY